LPKDTGIRGGRERSALDERFLSWGGERGGFSPVWNYSPQPNPRPIRYKRRGNPERLEGCFVGGSSPADCRFVQQPGRIQPYSGTRVCREKALQFLPALRKIQEAHGRSDPGGVPFQEDRYRGLAAMLVLRPRPACASDSILSNDT